MPSEYKFCRYCGRELPRGSALNFCPYCGKRLSAPPTETVKTPVEAPAPEAPSAPIEPPKSDIILLSVKNLLYNSTSIKSSLLTSQRDKKSTALEESKAVESYKLTKHISRS